MESTPEPAKAADPHTSISEELSPGEQLGAGLLLLPAPFLAFLTWRQHDSDASTFSGLLIDRFLQAAPFLIAGAFALLLLKSPKVTTLAVLFASAVALVTSVTLVAAGFAAAGRDVWAAGVATGSLAALVTSCAALLIVLRHLRSSTPLGLPPLTTALVLSVVAGILPLIQFWNDTLYLPARTDIAIGQTITVAFDGTRGATDQSLITYELRNDTDTRVFVVLSAAYVCTYPQGTLITGQATTGKREPCNNRMFEPIVRKSWISAKSSLTVMHAIETPHAQPLLHVRTKVAYANGDRLRTAYSPADLDVSADGDCTNITATRIAEASRYEELVQDSKYLLYYDRGPRIGYGIVGEGDQHRCIPEREGAYESRNNALARSYGLAEAEFVWEGRPAAEKPKPAAENLN